MEFKTGDKVKIREDLLLHADYGRQDVTQDMLSYKGKIVTIKSEASREGEYFIEEDNARWSWSKEMFGDLVAISEEMFADLVAIEENTILFAKVNPKAIIPSKEEENGGYDIYACFEEDFMLIQPHEIKMIPTGIASAFDSKYVMILKERGSSGTKGMATRSGVIDSGYRGEWFVPINNTTDNPIIISKFNEEETIKKLYRIIAQYPYVPTIYPYEKAICQALLLPVPNVKVEEISYEDLKNIKSNRGTGALGSSGK